jgi:hypothetical protein
MSDLGNIRAFHAVMMSCLATGSTSPISVVPNPPACANLTLSDMPALDK